MQAAGGGEKQPGGHGHLEGMPRQSAPRGF